MNHSMQFSSNDLSFIDEIASDGNNYTRVLLPELNQTDNVGKTCKAFKVGEKI